MKKHETLSKGEELLKHVLEECLEEDLSFVPPEREIARKHHFSEQFEEKMQTLFEQFKKKNEEHEIRKHFHPRYGHLAACVLVFCVCGWLFYSVIGPVEKQAAMESAPAEGAPQAPSATDAVTEESAVEEAAPLEGEMKEETESESGVISAAVKEYCGHEVYLAEQQEVPEYLDYVTTLVNCPVLDEEAPVLFLTIGNIGEETIEYLTHYDLEVWLSDGWYVLPPHSEGDVVWKELEAGMAVDEELDLSVYDIDYDAEKYRLITYVNEDLISAEFTFEDVFEEQMEELEELEEEFSGE